MAPAGRQSTRGILKRGLILAKFVSLFATASLLLLGACAATPPQPPIEVTFHNVLPSQLSRFLATRIELISMAESRIGRDERERGERWHRILSRSPTQLVVQSESAEVRTSGYIKLTYDLQPVGNDTRVRLTINYVQNPGTRAEIEVRIENAVQVRDPTPFVKVFNRDLQALSEIHDTLKGAAPLPADPRPMAAEWEGQPALLSAKSWAPANSRIAAIQIERPGTGGPRCGGTMQVASTTGGTWYVECPDGLAAFGRYRMNPEGGSVGEGTDNQGKRVRYTMPPRPKP
jgi:hypothetical protein